MKRNKHIKTITSITYPVFALFAVACFALSPRAGAQCPQQCNLNNYNTAVGYGALFNNSGVDNTAIGIDALFHNISGANNTAAGASALFNNTTGNNNNAYGAGALHANTTGPYNNAFGNGALASNISGDRNTAIGEGAMTTSTTGYQNTAVGVSALRNNSHGFYNVAIGQDACNLNGGGFGNTGVGWQALLSNGANNSTAVGMDALVHSTGSSNVGLGAYAGSHLTTGNGNVCIGAGVLGLAGESNTTRIRNIYSSVATARAVYIGSDNKIGTLSSSRRYKEEIKPMEKASETLFALKPVTFRYKKEVDAERLLSFGLIAEDVAEISPELVTRDEKGNPQTVRYEAVNAMLLNEFLKEHRKVERLEATIAKQHTDFEAALADLKGQIQKVGAQLKLSKAAPQTVLNR